MWSIVTLFVVIIVACIAHDLFDVHEKFETTQSPAISDLTTTSTPWTCHKIQNWDTYNYEDGYVIARKDVQGRPQCVRMTSDPNNIMDHTQQCSIFNSANTCDLARLSIDALQPYSCPSEAMVKNTDTCTQLKRNIWQCRSVKDGKFNALRKNADNDIECLGNTFDTCMDFNSLVECTLNVQNVKNDRYLKCGEMMWLLFGKDGYSDPEHYCSKYRNIVM